MPLMLQCTLIMTEMGAERWEIGVDQVDRKDQMMIMDGKKRDPVAACLLHGAGCR